jgi:murein DD-endopeptidase MepM/ murein hydrolase activator NlpD
VIARRAILGGSLALAAPHVGARSLDFDRSLMQGALVVGRVAAGTRVEFEERELRVGADGRFVVGFGREQPREATLALVHPDGRRESRKLEILPRRFDIQRIDGLPPRMVEPSEEDLARIKRDNQLIGAARRRDSPEAMWASGWMWPVEGRISGVWGSQRVLNGQPRRPHFGVDVAMPTGTPVVAPANGIVSLAEADLYFTGGTIMLDHGHGVSTIYAHLSAVESELGRRVRRGEQIGRIGATGRVTGPHLHLGMNWFATHVDPALVLPPMSAR